MDPEATFRRYNGARHANGYGVCNADYQARMAAMACNLKRWAILTKGRSNVTGTRRQPTAVEAVSYRPDSRAAHESQTSAGSPADTRVAHSLAAGQKPQKLAHWRRGQLTAPPASP
ncbi:MAG: hypothetical protein IPK16_17985 [Anaerolineales bacterium]|nr:hypothetical protein [Anaerolineales bacterium]